MRDQIQKQIGRLTAAYLDQIFRLRNELAEAEAQNYRLQMELQRQANLIKFLQERRQNADSND